MGLFIALIASPPGAATKYYSTFAKNGVTPVECTQEVSIVNPLLAEFHAPTDWNWIVACDEAAWQKIEVMSGFPKALNGQIMGLTDLDRKIPYVRGWVILHPVSQANDAQPRHIIAHELGHVLANTRNEVRAEETAQLLLKESDTGVTAALHEVRLSN